MGSCISVPVATDTGFNPRHPDTGGAGQLLEYLGTTIPFAIDAAGREASGDPRPSIAERYPSCEDYLEQVRDAARKIVEERLILSGDVELCVFIAAERYDAVIQSKAGAHLPR